MNLPRLMELKAANTLFYNADGEFSIKSGFGAETSLSASFLELDDTMQVHILVRMDTQ